MNYLQQFINFSNLNLNIDSYSDLVSEIQKISKENLNEYPLILPFSIGKHVAFKPILWKELLLIHPFKNDIEYLLNNSVSEDIIYWNPNDNNVYLTISISEINTLTKSIDKKNFINKVQEQIKNLTSNLPFDVDSIAGLKYKFSSDSDFETNLYNPLVKLLEIFKEPSFVEIFFKNYPQILETFKLDSNFYRSNPLLQKKLKTIFSGHNHSQASIYSEFVSKFSIDDSITSPLAYLGLQHNLLDDDIELYKKHFNEPSNIKYPKVLNKLLIYIISQNNVQALKSLFQDKEFLSAFMKESDSSNFSNHYAYYIRDKEMLNYFIETGIPLFYELQPVDSSCSSYKQVYKSFDDVKESLEKLKDSTDFSQRLQNQEFSFSFIPYSYQDNIQSINSLMLLTEILPDLNNSDYLNHYAKNLFTFNSVKDYSLIYKNIPNIDLSKVDVFYYIFNKTNYDIAYYKEAIENGYDPRNCKEFIKAACLKTEGAKLIRALNKEGVIVSKNPDYIFNTYKYSTTKNLTAVFDKTSEEVFNKYTIDGFPAWWGALSKETLSFTASKSFDITQTSKFGQNIFQFFMNIFHTEIHKFNDFNSIIEIVKSHLKDEDFKFDFSVTNHITGDNIFHDFFLVNYNNKPKISTINSLISISNDNLLSLLDTPNNKGVYPIDLIISSFSDKNYKQTSKNIIESLVKEFLPHISLTRKDSSGNIIGNVLLEIINEDLAPFVEKELMLQENNLSNRNHIKQTKVLKF